MSYVEKAREVSARWQEEQVPGEDDHATDGGIRGIKGEKPPVVDADTLRQHLATLYPGIARGCSLGLHHYLERVPAEVVRAFLSTIGPDTPEEDTIAACRRAGEAATLLALVQEYRRLLHLLRETGHDVFPEAAALELALCHPAPTP